MLYIIICADRYCRYWGKDISLGKTIPLVLPSATLVVLYHIETSAGQHILNNPAEVTVLNNSLDPDKLNIRHIHTYALLDSHSSRACLKQHNTTHVEVG